MSLRDLMDLSTVGPQDCADVADKGDYRTWLDLFKQAAETGQPFPVVQLGRRFIAAPEAVLRAFGIDPTNGSAPTPVRKSEGQDTNASVVAFLGTESEVADA